MITTLPNELPVTSDPNDVPPWRPNKMHIGIGLRFTNPDGTTCGADVGREIQDGETLEKALNRILREAFARAHEFGLRYDKNYKG